MESWKQLSKSSRTEDVVIKKVTVDELVEDSLSSSKKIWDKLGVGKFYSAGKMMGSCDGPDVVSLGDVVSRFSGMISNLVTEIYTERDLPPPKTILDMFRLSSKSIGELESTELKVDRVKLISMLNGFSDGYIGTSDPESVKNINSVSI